MSGIDMETKRKLREMGAAALLEAFEAEDGNLVLGMGFEERLRLIVDEAHSTLKHGKIEGLIRRAGLRYPAADLRRLDLVEERGLNAGVIAALGTCGFIERHQNVVFQGFTGSGKSYLGCALAKQACQHRFRAHYICQQNLPPVPDMAIKWYPMRDYRYQLPARVSKDLGDETGEVIGGAGGGFCVHEQTLRPTDISSQELTKHY